MLAALTLVAVLIPVVARLFGCEAGPLAIAVSLMPWVTLACVVPIVLALVARSWWLVAASAAVLALCVAWSVPMFTGQHAGGDEALRVASINMTFGEAAADEVVRLVQENHVDVLAVQEVTPEAVVALKVAGLEKVLPFSVDASEPGFKGTALWSRTPLRNTESLDGFVSRAVRGTVDVVGGRSLDVFAVHPAAPGPRAHLAWDADLARLTALLAAQDGPTLVVGDLNTTRDHKAFRALEGLGFADAADQAGAGFLPTFPQGRGPLPFVAIDHALMGRADLIATSAKTAVVSGADHRMLLVTYAES